MTAVDTARDLSGPPGPNDRLACGTESARRRHLAHGQTCVPCGVDDEQPGPLPLVCAGRAALANGRTDPESIPCPRRSPVVPEYVNDGTGRPRPSTAADRDERARAAGWSVPPPPAGPMCPACRRPSPELSRLVRDLTRPASAGRTNTTKEN